jgi:hypothetical protein
VAQRARSVRIADAALERYAASLPADEILRAAATALPRVGGSEPALVAFVLELDAVNFGSGWFPELVKRPALSGYRTIEAALVERFERDGPIGVAELRAMDAAACARLFGQTAAPPAIGELMELFARAWRELGEWLALRHGGDFAAPLDAAAGSAEALVRELLEMPLYRDVATYDELDVPFLKRAQITAADLALALPERARFRDLDRLTLFADNLVPHVLRVDGVLAYEPGLLARIDAGELLAWGSREEVEIRACALDAVERLVARLRERGVPATAARLDHWLWQRGAAPSYKARPRHRTRCPYY